MSIGTHGTAGTGCYFTFVGGGQQPDSPRLADGLEIAVDPPVDCPVLLEAAADSPLLLSTLVGHRMRVAGTCRYRPSSTETAPDGAPRNLRVRLYAGPPDGASALASARLTHLGERSEARVLSEMRHSARSTPTSWAFAAADHRIKESNLTGECSRLCVRGAPACTRIARRQPLTGCTSELLARCPPLASR